jgi:ribosome biogenesis GTPase
MASLQDRSKYKKTDQDQLKKQEKALPENLTRGRVLAISPEGILVDSEGKLINCLLKGAMKKEKGRMKNLVAVGDFVHFEPKGENEGSIAYVEERRSFLARAEHHQRHQQQLIAVNVDQVLITTSVIFPSLKPHLVDRYIIAARKGKMAPVILINKVDLLVHPPENLSADLIEKEKELFAHFLETYRSLGFLVIPVSCETKEGLEELKQTMEGKTSVFSGQSGVGKSSLINQVTGSSLEIGRIVAKTMKGTHTTTTTHLIPISGGGFCVDTPGIKSFGVWDLSREEIQDYFSEIREVAKKCRFPDCNHLQEPDCAVLKAVEKGKISPLRFDSYYALITSLSTKHTPR